MPTTQNIDATELLMQRDPDFRARVLALRAGAEEKRKERQAAIQQKKRDDAAWLRRRNARAAARRARDRYAKTEKGLAARARASARYIAKLRYSASLGELA